MSPADQRVFDQVAGAQLERMGYERTPAEGSRHGRRPRATARTTRR